MKPRMTLVALFCMAFILSACGGSGRGVKPADPPPPPIPLVNGGCAATLNMCVAGSLNDTADTDTNYLWQCAGSGGGTTASCSLPKEVEPPSPPPIPLVNGGCAATLNMCVAGSFGDTADTDTDHLWQCAGSGGGTTASCSLPKEVEPPSPPPEPKICADGAAGAEDPLLCKRGHNILPGIDQIPLNLVKLTNTQMQQHFVIVEVSAAGHGRSVRETACETYITGCADKENTPGYIRHANGTVTRRSSGSTPFTMLEDFDALRAGVDTERDLLDEMSRMGSVKILVLTVDPLSGWFEGNAGARLPFLAVVSAGNRKSDEGNVSEQDPLAANIRAATAANKVLYAAGHRIVDGNYMRHQSSSGCTGPVNDGCLWVPFLYAREDGVRFATGTSHSAPALASSLASVLSVFPDTTHQNLAKFGKACAKKSGQGIEALLSSAGGVGVADFSCMGEVTTALANLPNGGSTTATINGSSVTVRGRDISLSFANNNENATIASNELWGLSFGMVPTGEEGLMAVATKRQGNLFASLGGGVREDFFGFSKEHGAVRVAEISAGHDRVFARYSEQHSSGGGIIDSAKGRSFGFTAKQHFALTEESVLSAAAHADKFLGGSAHIPVGAVNLEGGEWNYRLSLGATTRLSENTTITTSAHARFPGDGGDEEMQVGVQFSQRF